MEHVDAIHIELPAKYENLALIRAVLAAIMEPIPDLEDPATVVYNVQLATHEICLNIIQHAYKQQDGRIRLLIDLKLDSRLIVIDLFDTGMSFDIGAVPPPNLDEPQIHGYGLFIAQQLMDKVEYHPSPGSNHWKLQKHF